MGKTHHASHAQVGSPSYERREQIGHGHWPSPPNPEQPVFAKWNIPPSIRTALLD